MSTVPARVKNSQGAVQILPVTTKAKFLSSITHPDGTVSSKLAVRQYAFGVVLAPVDPDRLRAGYQRTIDGADLEIPELTERLQSEDVVIERRSHYFPSAAFDYPDTDEFGNHSYYKHMATFRGSAEHTQISSFCDSAGMAMLDFYPDAAVPVLQVLIAESRQRIGIRDRKRERALNWISHIDAGTADLAGYRVQSWGVSLSRVQKTAAEWGGLVVPVD